MNISIHQLTDDVVRVRMIPPGVKKITALEAYGYLFKDALKSAPANASKLEVTQAADGLLTATSNGKRLFTMTGCSIEAEGLRTVFDLFDPEEDWIGFGDQVRDRLFHRGTKIECVVTNVVGYIPVPFFMSTRGYAVLLNTTYHCTFDMGVGGKKEFGWLDRRGALDFYIFAGTDFKSLLRRYLDLTGKPVLPPLWSFGLWYICRTQANADEVIQNALAFRDRGIPCDVIGLEPGWMEVNYDLTTEKNWNKARFDLPDWQKKGRHHFISVLKRMGYHLELWMCMEYDLGYEEERRRSRIRSAALEWTEEDVYATRKDIDIDGHLGDARLADQVTNPDEPWFEHLKKFVDWGADFFKQDGAFQISFHHDRYWRGSQMNDCEWHNFYPLCYSRQMLEGFEQYTGRRGLVFTVSGWTGFQHYCGTWTGDTGGRIETLGAMLNTALVGHSFCTNDMEVAEAEGIHFGYLLPWSQVNSWTYFRMPWLQGTRLVEMHQRYAKLRSRLVPYIYSGARIACEGGDSLLLPLVMEYPEDRNCRTILHEYLLGPSLLVGIYKHDIYFPAGAWYDLWTGEIVASHGETRQINWPEEYGGVLYLRAGCVLPLGPEMAYRGEKLLDAMELLWYPATEVRAFEFYEDDGISFDYRSGKYAITTFANSAENGKYRLKIAVSGDATLIPVDRIWKISIVSAVAPAEIRVNGQALTPADWQFDEIRHRIELLQPLTEGLIELT